MPARREISKKLSETGEDGRKPLTNALFRGIILQKSSLFIAVFAFFCAEAEKRRSIFAMKNVILTGDRPTGRLHIGHYVG